MSHTHDIDNGGSLFEFDSNERFEPLSLLEDPARGPGTPSLFTSSHIVRARFDLDDSPLPGVMSGLATPEVKGKRAAVPGASEPMSIPLAEDAQREPDIFSLSFAGVGSPSSRYDPRLSCGSPTSQPAAFGDVESICQVSADDEAAGGGGKGKGRELPPTLPPLSFSPTQFSYETEWSSTAGPSSYESSGYSLMGDAESSPGSPSPSSIDRASDSTSAPSTPALSHAPTTGAPRRRTISNVSRHSLRSLSTPSLPKMKAKFATSKGASGTLARKLLFKKSPPTSPRASHADLDSTILDPQVPADLTDLQFPSPGCCVIPWSREMQSRSPLASPVVEINTVWGVVDSQRVPRSSLPVRTKGRAYSSPLPLPSFNFDDIVPLAPADLYEVPPERDQTSYFEDYLPHELKLHILVALVDLHQAEFEKRVADGKWTAHKASSSRSKWVGRDKGVRELFKLSRVGISRSSLSWAMIDLRRSRCLIPGED